MSEQITMGEMTRWLQGIEKRMGEMHGENRAGLAKIELVVADLAELQRVQNGNVANVKERTAVLEQRATSIDRAHDALDRSQQAMAQRLEEIRDAALRMATQAATQAATGAAAQAIHETAPNQKRMTALGAIAAGVTTGGMLGLYWVGKFLFDVMTK